MLNVGYFHLKLMKFLVIFALIYNTECYKILAVIPHASRSHWIIFEPLFVELANRGHNVTVISHFPQKESLPNYHDVSIAGTSPLLRDVVSFKISSGSFIERIAFIFFLASVNNKKCETGLKSLELQNFMKKQEKYDIFLTELFTTNCYVGLMHLTGGSLIGLTSTGMFHWTNEFMGNPDNPSYIPSLFNGYTDTMTFMERTQNFITYIVSHIVYRLLIDIPANTAARRLIDPNLPHLSDFVYNTSVILTNFHHTLHTVKPNVPGVVEVGGMHCTKPKKLSQHLEKWINESTDGVIFFSMGSMIKGHTFPEEKREMFVRAFARLKQRVLWKWENETLPNKPDNVMIQKWMPQFDILSHPNVKAFITHGGLLSTTEAVHCGVPAVVMPQFGDQFTNARALESSGGGIILHFSTITEEDVYNALKTVLDPSFNKQAKELSVRFKDRPMPPLETAIYWIEYVARHKGAPHLRSAAVGMPYYQYLLLDVIAFLLLVILVASYISFIVTRFIFRKLFKKQVKVKKQ